MEHKLRNQIISHRILNYLNAGYQGKFTALNILSRLEVPGLGEYTHFNL